eukprot:2358983-Pleurochrysis_carterae.AAC.1
MIAALPTRDGRLRVSRGRAHHSDVRALPSADRVLRCCSYSKYTPEGTSAAAAAAVPVVPATAAATAALAWAPPAPLATPRDTLPALGADSVSGDSVTACGACNAAAGCACRRHTSCEVAALTTTYP